MRIFRDDCAALAIDFQEKLVPAMYNKEELLKKSTILLTGLKLLDVPVIETRQYPRGLGETVPEIKEAMRPLITMDKLAFGCCDDAATLAVLEQTAKKTVIVCGVESHVCVLQTVIGLKSRGFTPVLVADCISSRAPADIEYAVDPVGVAAIIPSPEYRIIRWLSLNTSTCMQLIML
jgi:nicotinamidase-related amidase